MMKVKGILILFIAISSWSVGNGQDALFSQLNKTKNLFNPSLLTTQNLPIEIQLNYREQGGSLTSALPLRTFQVLANFTNTSFKVDKLSYGLSVMSDRGGTGHIGSNMAHLHFGYLKKLTGAYSNIGEHYIGIGTSLGAGQRYVVSDRFWFGNQFNEEYNFIEEGKDPKEDELLSQTSGQSGFISDINAGISWYANLNEGLALSGGLGMFHLERANISLIAGQVERQKIRYNAHLTAWKSVSDLVALSPQMRLTIQGNSAQLVYGTEIAIDNRDENEFVVGFGFFGRNVTNLSNFGFESIIITLNVDYSRFIFGIGYDITVSSLSRFNNGRGAWEFRLGYAFGEGSKTGYRRDVPQFRM